mmetsp:Transcript_19377/g.59839  ORF Transcript_19377/g.59839 Transcript_19377/m.59839 type:complete len:292 (-) Transcript_19377:1654-2529(-)
MDQHHVPVVLRQRPRQRHRRHVLPEPVQRQRNLRRERLGLLVLLRLGAVLLGGVRGVLLRRGGAVGARPFARVSPADPVPRRRRRRRPEAEAAHHGREPRHVLLDALLRGGGLELGLRRVGPRHLVRRAPRGRPLRRGLDGRGRRFLLLDVVGGRGGAAGDALARGREPVEAHRLAGLELRDLALERRVLVFEARRFLPQLLVLGPQLLEQGVHLGRGLVGAAPLGLGALQGFLRGLRRLGRRLDLRHNLDLGRRRGLLLLHGAVRFFHLRELALHGLELVLELGLFLGLG